MKRPYSLTVLIVLTLAFNCESQVFNKYFPTNRASWGMEVFVNPDSTITVFSTYFDTLTKTTPGLAIHKLDKSGNLLLQKELFGKSSHGFQLYNCSNMIERVSNFSFIAIGIYYNSNNYSAPIVAKINAITLDTIWTRKYSDPLYEVSPNNLIRSGINQFFLIGNKFDNTDITFKQRPVVLTCDTLGNLKYKMDITAMVDTDTRLAVFDTNTKSILIAYNDISNSIGFTSNVASLDTNGFIKWNSLVGSANYFISFSNMKLNNGNLYLCGSYLTYNSSRSNVTVTPTYLKLNASTGLIKWQRVLPYNDPENNFAKIIVNNEGSLIMSGSLKAMPNSSNPNKTQAVLFKSDSTGNGIWLKQFNGLNQQNLIESSRGIAVLHDAGFVLTGYQKSPSSVTWVATTNSLGISVNSTTLIAITNTVSETNLVNIKTQENFRKIIRVYPIPASEQLTFEFVDYNNSTLDDIELHFHDVEGKPVYFIAPNLSEIKEGMSKSFTISCKNWKTGVYELLVKHRGSPVFATKIIKSDP